VDVAANDLAQQRLDDKPHRRLREFLPSVTPYAAGRPFRTTTEISARLTRALEHFEGDVSTVDANGRGGYELVFASLLT
jgi:hypothetical protein